METYALFRLAIGESVALHDRCGGGARWQRSPALPLGAIIVLNVPVSEPVHLEIERLTGEPLVIENADRLAEAFFSLDRSSQGADSYDAYILAQGRSPDNIAAARMCCSGEAFSVPGSSARPGAVLTVASAR